MYRTVTAPNCFNRIAISKNIAHSLEPCEMSSSSASYKAPNYVQLF